jgi:hypothetical protein
MSQQDQLGARALKLLAGESMVAVLRALADGALRPTELEQRLPDAGHSVVMRRLRHLLDSELCWIASLSPERTTRLTERVISQSLGEDPDAPAPSPLMVRRIVAGGARVARARLLDGHAAELAGELWDLCSAAAAPPGGRLTATGRADPRRASSGAVRDKNRPLYSNPAGATVLGRGRLRRSEPFR